MPELDRAEGDKKEKEEKIPENLMLVRGLLGTAHKLYSWRLFEKKFAVK